MAERDNDRIPENRPRDPLATDPNRPHRNPNMIHPAPRSDDVDQRPNAPAARSRSSSTWVWILIGGVALIAIFSFFTVGTGDRGDVTTTGTVPPTVTTEPVDPATPVQPVQPQ